MRGGKTTLTSKSSSPSSSSLSSSILFGKRGVASQFQHPSTSSSFSSTSSPFFSFIRTFNTKQNKTFSPFPRSTSFFTRGNNEKSSLQLLKSPSKPFTFSNSFTQFRLFTTSESQKDFTLQDAKDALKQILAISQQKPYSDVLLQLKRADISIIIKWQFLVGQINEIIKLVGKEYDFSDSVQFQLKIFDMMAEDSTGGLQKEYVRNWDAWLFLVFDFMASEHPFKFDVARTRLLISDLLDAFQSPDYLLLVNQIYQDEKLTEEEKTKKFIEVATPQHMNVIEQYGFEGEIGYLQSQRIITCEYAHDKMIRKLCDTAARLSYQL